MAALPDPGGSERLRSVSGLERSRSGKGPEVSPGRSISYLILVPAVFGLCPGAAAAQREVKRHLEQNILKEVVTPRRIFERIESAWKAGDAETISSFVGDGKVLVQTGPGGRGGFYSRPQVFYLLKRMFKETELLRFEFVKFHNLEKPGRKVYAIAYRSSRALRSDKVSQDKVYITLGREGKDWVIVEIKTAG